MPNVSGVSRGQYGILLQCGWWDCLLGPHEFFSRGACDWPLSYTSSTCWVGIGQDGPEDEHTVLRGN